MRTDITFLSGGVWCAGWLYRPDGADSRRVPCVVMAHGFSCTRELRLDAYAERFCAAGLGVLLFDYRHFGDSAGEPRQLLDIKAQLADYRAGKDKLFGFFIGQVMKATSGKANPARLNELLKRKLSG